MKQSGYLSIDFSEFDFTDTVTIDNDLLNELINESEGGKPVLVNIGRGGCLFGQVTSNGDGGVIIGVNIATGEYVTYNITNEGIVTKTQIPAATIPTGVITGVKLPANESYTIPTDGYIRTYIYSGAPDDITQVSLTLYRTPTGTSTITVLQKPTTGASVNTVFVKKGLSVLSSVNATNAYSEFLALTYE